ncbi:DUF3509 domain-containing protein [Pseudomonas sp. UM16]|uniref:DUF3509 domain-containing protein n=1 Tax=Pseudomonas sp. UM16 TaxID=3158962 RepID=UPI00398FE145
MKCLGSLLSEALAPYQVMLQPQGSVNQFNLLVVDESSQTILRRSVALSELQSQSLLVDLVDGLQRDLRIVEGRLQPSMIAVMQQVQQQRGQSLSL